MPKKYNKSPLKLILRGNVYHLKISTVVNGKRIFIRESTHTTDKCRAEQYANKRFAQAVEQAEYRTNPNKLKEFTLNQAFGLYWEEKGQYHSKPDDTFNKLENLNKYFDKDLRVSELSIDDIAGFVSLKKQEGCKTGTINRYLAVISAILNLCKKYRVATPDIYVRDFIKKEPVEFVKYYNKEEFDRIYEHAAPHFKPIMLMALHTGFRMSTLLNLKWEDVRDGMIFYRVKDSSYEHGRPVAKKITPSMLEVLNALPKVNAYLFTYNGERIKSVKKAWKRAVERAGVPYKSFHTLRHTHGTWLYAYTKDLKLVQESLDHKNQKTTERYVHTVDNGLTQIYERAFSTKLTQISKTIN